MEEMDSNDEFEENIYKKKTRKKTKIKVKESDDFHINLESEIDFFEEPKKPSEETSNRKKSKKKTVTEETHVQYEETPKKKKKKKKEDFSDDEDEICKKKKKKNKNENQEEEEEVTKKKKKKKKKYESEDEDEQSEDEIKKKRKKSKIKKETSLHDIEQIDSEKKLTRKKSKKVVDENEDDTKKLKKKKSKKHLKESDNDDEEEKVTPVKRKKSKKHLKESDNDEDEEIPVKRRKSKKSLKDLDESSFNRKSKKSILPDEEVIKKKKKKNSILPDSEEELEDIKKNSKTKIEYENQSKNEEVKKSKIYEEEEEISVTKSSRKDSIFVIEQNNLLETKIEKLKKAKKSIIKNKNENVQKKIEIEEYVPSEEEYFSDNDISLSKSIQTNDPTSTSTADDVSLGKKDSLIQQYELAYKESKEKFESLEKNEKKKQKEQEEETSSCCSCFWNIFDVLDHLFDSIDFVDDFMFHGVNRSQQQNNETKTSTSKVELKSREKMKYFQTTLQNILQLPGENKEIPKIVDLITSYINKYCLNENFLFFNDSSRLECDNLIEEIEDDISKFDPRKYSVNILCTVFKRFLFSLQLPVISKHLFDKYVDYSDEENVEQIKELNRELPNVNYLVLRKTIEMLYFIKENGEKNDMNSIKLASIFGDLILRGKKNESRHKLKQSCLFLIQNFIEIFNVTEDEKKIWPLLSGVADDEPDEYRFPIENENLNLQNQKSFKLINIGIGDVDIDKTVKFKGEILMKNNFTKKWKSVYIILRQDKLVVFNSKDDWKNGRNHILSLFMEYAVVEDEEDVKDRQFCFSVRFTKKETKMDDINQ
eukprot:gene10286-2703_t